MKPALTLTALLLTALCASPVAAQDAPRSAFDHEFAVAGYATGLAGTYAGAGIGGRLRWEPFAWLGIEAYLEGTLIESRTLRHDYPNGFNLYVPVRLGRDVRFRPFVGFCDVLSFSEPQQQGAPRSDDVLFGAHVGVGVEWNVWGDWTVFSDLRWSGYAGHDRAAGGWTGGVGEDLQFFWYAQLDLGVQLHFGGFR